MTDCPRPITYAMRLTPATLFAPTPSAFWHWGRLLLVAGLSLGLLLVVYLAWSAPEVLPVVPLILLGLTAAWHLFRYPLLNLCVLLAGYVVLLNYEEGIQATEALYGLYCLSFLAHWFATRLFVYREPILERPEAKALFLFLIGITLSFGLTLLFGGSMRHAFSEWVALLMLAFFFPIREACARYKNGTRWVLLVLVWVGLFVVLRNLWEYRLGLQNAEFAYQIARGRATTNDNLLMSASLISLVFLLFAERLRTRAVMLGLFLTFFGGLILSFSRGYWLAFALGAFVVFWLLGRRHKQRLVVLLLVGMSGLVGIGLLFFGDYIMLMLAGLIERFASLGSATKKDISLLGRLYETRAALPLVLQNPILGRGMGVSFSWFDVITQTTVVRTFIHNGYLSLWYRFGLWGLGLILFWWGASIWRGIQIYRLRPARPVLRIVGLATAGTLVAFTLSANTSNPFFLNDATFAFGILTGLVAGAYERGWHERRPKQITAQPEDQA